jgi:beta-glucosidase
MAAGAREQGVVRFPDGFVWGVATAAYQIEGAAAEGGRRPSIWDTFSHANGNIRRGDTGDIACDAYHRLEEDLALLEILGVGAYRFSVSWARVMPDGNGRANPEGLDYYRRLVDGLRARSIEPFATLYHWDLPQALEDAGGWPVRSTADRFADFAAAVVSALGDGVRHWITINEPQVVASHGYRRGVHAPGRREPAAAAAATHHLLLAHGLGVQVIRELAPSGTEVGITLDLTTVRAADDASGDLAQELEAEMNDLYLGPVLGDGYPAGHVPDELLPDDSLVHCGDMALIATPIDFLGINYYRSFNVRRRADDEARRGERPLEEHPGIVSVTPDGVPETTTGWPVDADGLCDLLVSLGARVPRLPLYVTENGMAAEDYVDPEGDVDDHERVEYLRDHLGAVREAMDRGVDVRGYFCWSFLDNFEWAEGYQKRFGLFYVDFGTQRRIPKASASFYSEVVRTNLLLPSEAERAAAANASSVGAVRPARSEVDLTPT